MIFVPFRLLLFLSALAFYEVLCQPLLIPLSFFFIAIVLHVLRIMACDYFFGIF